MGQPAKKANVELDDGWLNTDGKVVHPSAPLGGGGLGQFRTPATIGGKVDDDDALPHTRSPATRLLDPLQVKNVADTKAKGAVVAKPAPVVDDDITQTIQGMTVTIKNDIFNVEGIAGAKTRMWSDPANYDYDFKNAPGHEIVKFTAPVITIFIQTQYGESRPSTKSAYGRGTTTEDVDSGNVTLGFHESCHRQDYIDGLTRTAPPVFGGKVGMKEEAFKAATAAWKLAFKRYIAGISHESDTKTDEVGAPTKAQYCQQNPGTCPDG